MQNNSLSARLLLLIAATALFVGRGFEISSTDELILVGDAIALIGTICWLLGMVTFVRERKEESKK